MLYLEIHFNLSHTELFIRNNKTYNPDCIFTENCVVLLLLGHGLERKHRLWDFFNVKNGSFCKSTLSKIFPCKNACLQGGFFLTFSA